MKKSNHFNSLAIHDLTGSINSLRLWIEHKIEKDKMLSSDELKGLLTEINYCQSILLDELDIDHRYAKEHSSIDLRKTINFFSVYFGEIYPNIKFKSVLDKEVVVVPLGIKRIINNILINGFENALTFVSIKLELNSEFLCISVFNDKDSSKGHIDSGIGISSVDHCLKMVDGRVEYSDNEDQFEVFIEIPIQETLITDIAG